MQNINIKCKRKKKKLEKKNNLKQMMEEELGNCLMSPQLFLKKIFFLYFSCKISPLSKVCSYLCISFFLYFIINSWASKEIRKRKLIFGKGKYLQGNDKKVNLILCVLFLQHQGLFVQFTTSIGIHLSKQIGRYRNVTMEYGSVRTKSSIQVHL